ncbi:hypothetical protein JRQ81_006063 [Phrynocephalus forsythii]|uniref:VWFA domain-containing protein n=1 Tax=Phrynocephalus forsythii TaxID=171643 RepID=A0A9Q0XKA1_9SAUR|nr:hypothetical protein JRQ81_006063 [Phrynocephalus forsythii]
MVPLPLIICLGTLVLAPCWAFSLDTLDPIIFQEAVAGFGQSVAQFGSGANAGVLVSAPLQKGDVNETGKLYSCQPLPGKLGRCQEVALQRPADAVNMSLGLSLSAHGSQSLVCGPTVYQTCGENIYLKGYCFLLDQNLRQTQRFPDSLPECPKRLTDIVLLIDGSGSIEPSQFRQMKTFIVEVMKRFQNTNTQFALSQYSNRYREHFDFLEFQRTPDPNALLRRVQQLGGLTYTATYIQKVVRDHFLPGKGARHDASKVLIVITDGVKTGDPLEYSDVIPEAEQVGIIRFAIGVGQAFSQGTAFQELQSIASSPASDHVFPVSNFNALKDIQKNLEDKIFAIEGTQSQSGSSFQLEMSQEGFSALLTSDGSMLGAVGAYDWSGGIFLYRNNGVSSFINMSSFSKDMKDAYLGYSVAAVHVNGRNSYVVGAPRFQHAGKVVLFSQENGEWKRKSELSSKQVSSIQRELCISSDCIEIYPTSWHVPIKLAMWLTGCTGIFLLLKGYPSGGTFHCRKELQGEPKHPLGRFGATIAEIGEITGDRWVDVAIGAPMEDENQGAVYIFRGSSRSLNGAYSQRIKGFLATNRLHYFGQAIGAGSDLTGDGLPDVAVGAEGRVLLLRTRPVLSVTSSISFNPPLLPLPAFECQDQETLNKEVSKATVCLTIKSDPRFTLGNILSTIRYTLALDHGRTKIRAIFAGGSGSSSITEEMQVGLTTKCKDYRITLPTCIEDSLNPINLHLNYTLTGEPIHGAGNLRPVLGEDQPHQFTASLPFEKNCGKDGVCKDQLKTSFNFSGLDTLVVGLTPELNATVFIQNSGEDSYSTTVTFLYPSALSYRRFILLQSNRKYVMINCASPPAAEEALVRNTTCGINHPIFRTGAEVIFIATFSVAQEANLGSVVHINATASSENNGPITQDMIHHEKLSVKYAVFVFVNAIDESTKSVNFSDGQEGESRVVEHRYEVKNTYQRKVPVSVRFQFPVKLNGTWIWNASLEIPSELFHLVQCAPEKETPGSKDFVKQLRERPILDCSVASCKTIRCDITSLDVQQPLELRINGTVGFKWVSQTQQNTLTLVSSAQIFYDEKKYFQKEGFVQSQVKTVVEHLVVYNYLPIIIGSSIGGLVLLALIVAGLYKLGFFKRQYKQMMDEAVDGSAEGAGPSQDTVSPSPAATKG